MGSKLEREAPYCEDYGMASSFKDAKPFIKSYILAEDWEGAALFGDMLIVDAIIANEDRVWDEVKNITIETNIIGQNVTAWGNCAMLIFHGQPFPERHQEIARLTDVMKWAATHS